MRRKKQDELPNRKAEQIDASSSIEDIVPGKDLEKAASHIATAAGKSAIRGIANALGAATAEYFAKKVARAQAARLAIKTESEIDRERALTRAKHESELENIAQSGRVELAKRALDRVLNELSYQQENLEKIGARSIELIEAIPGEKPREFDPDWLFAFADFAQKISDEHVQELWARVLASASIEGKARLSPAALSLMASLDRTTANQFEFFCKIIGSIQSYPRSYSPIFGKIFSTPNVNLDLLLEIGLIRVTHSLEYHFLKCIMFIETEVKLSLEEKVKRELSPPLFESYVLSERGQQIFRAISGDSQDQKLDEDELCSILHGAILDKVAHFGAVKILSETGTVNVYRVLKEMAGLEGDPVKVSPVILRRIVERLQSNCRVEIT